MRKKEKPLTDQQKKAAAMYHDAYRTREIAEELGVHRTTVWRWTQLRGFWREYKRIEYNEQRRIMRREIKEEREQEAYWAEKVRIAKEKLDKETEKIKGKPGKAWYDAWNEWEKAMCRGRTVAEIMKLYAERKTGKYKKLKR